MQHKSEPRTGRHCLEDQTADSGFLESAVDSHRLSGPSAALCLTLELRSEPQNLLTEHWFPGGETLLPKPVQQSPQRSLKRLRNMPKADLNLTLKDVLSLPFHIWLWCVQNPVNYKLMFHKLKTVTSVVHTIWFPVKVFYSQPFHPVLLTSSISCMKCTSYNPQNPVLAVFST